MTLYPFLNSFALRLLFGPIPTGTTLFPFLLTPHNSRERTRIFAPFFPPCLAPAALSNPGVYAGCVGQLDKIRPPNNLGMSNLVSLD